MSLSLIVFFAVLAFVLASMAVFALFGSHADPDAARKGTQFLGGVGNFAVHWFMWFLGPAERLFLRWGWPPDVFNFAGLAFGAASGILIALGHVELGGWAIAVGGIADIFDGRIARARNLASEYGKFIDSTLDRFVEVFAFLGFVHYLHADHPWGPFAAAAAITGSLLVSYARARGESVGVLCKEGLMQRAERLVLTFLVCLLDSGVSHHLGRPPGTLAVWVLGLIGVGTFATATQRTVSIARQLREIDRQRATRS